jgi:hypothetical protein
MMQVKEVLDFLKEKEQRWEELMNSNDFPYRTELYAKQIGPAYLDAYRQVIDFIDKGGDK